MCFSISCHSIFLFSDGALPESASSCTLSNDDHFMSYYLTSEGVVSVRRDLYVVSYLNPDITYSPILQQVAAVLLHFMEEVWCFACISAMLTGKKPYFGETYLQALASDSALQACASSVMKKEMKKIQNLVLDEEWKANATLFPAWERMLFQYLDFTILVRLVDCFLAEGPKVFYRTALFIIRLFYEYSLKFEKIEFPTTADLMIAMGQYSEALKIPADDFIKAILRIKLKNRQIKTAVQKFMEDRKGDVLEADKNRDSEKTVNFDITNISDILTSQQWQSLINWLPERIQLLKPTVAFTTDEDGFSLKTMYNKVEEEDQSILILKTDKDEVFGAYLSMSLTNRKNSKKSLAFFGTGETFVFSATPLLEKFKWTEIEDGRDVTKDREIPKQKSSFVFVDIKGSPRRKRRSFRISRRKVSVKLQGIPKNFSLSDVPSQASYGGIPKNSSVVHLNRYSSISDNDHSAERTSPIQRLRGISASSDAKASSAASRTSSAVSHPDPDSQKRDGNAAALPHGKTPYQHSMSQGEAGDYTPLTDEDVDLNHRITQLPDDLCLVEKRIEIDHSEAEDDKRPEHAKHVKHAPNDLFIAGDDKCFIVGGGGGNSIWLDESLYRGRSEVSNTFHNRVLTKGTNGDFKCVRLEVFGFREPEI